MLSFRETFSTRTDTHLPQFSQPRADSVHIYSCLSIDLYAFVPLKFSSRTVFQNLNPAFNTHGSCKYIWMNTMMLTYTWFDSMECGLVAGEVAVHLLGAAEVPLSKAPNSWLPEGCPITLTCLLQLNVYGSCVWMFVFRAYVCVLYSGVKK